jgi:hypothetical protein
MKTVNSENVIKGFPDTIYLVGNPGSLQDNDGVDPFDEPFPRFQSLDDVFKEPEAFDTFEGRIRCRKENADVGFSSRAEEGIANGVSQRVTVGMA